MGLYLLHGSYSAEGTKGLLKDGGSKRRAAVESLVQQVGGKVHGAYFALGDSDFYFVADVPDAVAAVAISMVVNATGAVRLKTTPLMTPEELDAAAKKTIQYRAPGA
jgi:uncharacterized protein with GYD domain